MGFLNQLKSQADARRAQDSQQQADLDANFTATETASRSVLQYFGELARHLNVLHPDAPAMTLDGKAAWPVCTLVDFRVDARRKRWRDRDAADYVAIGWRIEPKAGAARIHTVMVNFLPDLERVQTRIAAGNLKHERKEIREGEKNALKAYVFECETESRASITATADHETAAIAFRMTNVAGFGIQTVTLDAEQIGQARLDELAKMVVSQPHAFC